MKNSVSLASCVGFLIFGSCLFADDNSEILKKLEAESRADLSRIFL